MNVTDEYLSRLQAIARQNKGIKFIRDIKNDRIEVGLEDGRSEWKSFEEVVNYKSVINESRKE